MLCTPVISYFLFFNTEYSVVMSFMLSQRTWPGTVNALPLVPRLPGCLPRNDGKARDQGMHLPFSSRETGLNWTP